MATLSQRLLVQAVDVRSKSNPKFIDVIKSTGDGLVRVVDVAAADRADLVANMLPTSPKWAERLDRISATATATIAEIERGHARSFTRTEELDAEMNTALPAGGEAWHPTLIADLRAMDAADRRIYLRSHDVAPSALAALKAYPLSATLVPPTELTDAIRSYNERAAPARAQELRDLTDYRFAVQSLIEDARRIIRDIVEGRADVPTPTPEPTRSFTRL